MISKDSRITNQLRNGSLDAFRYFYDKYSASIYRLSKKYYFSEEESEDVVQEVFLKLWNMRTELKPALSVKALLVSIGKNILINTLKKKALMVASKEYDFVFKDKYINSTEDYLILSDLKLHTDQFIDKLPPRKKQIFLLKKDHGFSNDEIANKLGLSKRTIENNIYQAEKAIKEFLSPEIISK